MTCAEHYFENLIFKGKDINGDPNKNSLPREVQEAIELCADYVKYTLFNNEEDFDSFIKREG